MNIFMLAQAQDAAGAAGQEPANMFQQILASPMAYRGFSSGSQGAE